MTTWALRAIAALYVVIAALTASVRLDVAERAVPMSADAAFTLDAGSASQPKAELAPGLARTAAEAGVAIAVIGRGDGGERIAYYFGAPPPTAKWYSPEFGATARPFDPASTTPMTGSYAVWGDPASLAAVDAWAAAAGIRATPMQFPTPLELTLSSLAKTSSVVPLLALLLAMTVALLAESARQARANTQKLLSGVRPGRIAAENALLALGAVLVPGFVGAAMAVGIVALRSGVEYIGPYAIGLAHLIVPFAALVLIIAVAITLFTWPSVVSIAERRNPVRHVTGAAEVVKVLALAAAIALVPIATNGLAAAIAARDEGTVWHRFADAVTVNNFGTTPGTPEDDAAGVAFAGAVAAADAGGRVQLAYELDAYREAITGFSGAFVVNRHYLETATASTPGELDARLASVPAGHPALVGLAPALDLALAPALRGDPGARFTAMTWRDGALPIASNAYLGAMRFVEAPLLLVVDDPGGALSPSFLLAATTRGGVIFDDETAMREALAGAGLEGRALSVDAVADQGLLDLQHRQQLLASRVIAFVLLVLAAVQCLWVSASAYVRSHAERFLPFALSGVPFARTFRGRLTWELSLIGVLTIAATIVAATIGADADRTGAAAALPNPSAALSVRMHLLDYRRLVANAIERRT